MSQDVEKVEHVRAKIEWVNGVPKIIGHTEVFSPKQVERQFKDLLTLSLNLPYTGKNPNFQGLTKGEAIIQTLVNDASDGIPEARKEVLDRQMGKPQQNIKSINLKGDLNDFLDQLEDPQETQDDAGVLDVEADVSRETDDSNVDDL